MTSLTCSIALAAAFAGAAANLAEAQVTPDGSEDKLTFAEGSVDGDRVRIVAGDLDGRGVLYLEYYNGAALRFVVPYTTVYVDGAKTSARALRGLQTTGTLDADGFGFTAYQGAAPLRCTALLYGDASANCTRDPAWIPPGAPACAAAFRSSVERLQCNGLRDIFQNPPIPHDEIIDLCAASFRPETYRTDCMRYGYNHPAALFRETLATCTTAMRTQDERKFCMFYSLAPVDAKQRVTVDMIRTCDRQHADDKQVSRCAFERLTGAKQYAAKQPATREPTDSPTEPLARVTTGTPVRGAHIERANGELRDRSLRVTGGMVGTEPVLWVDAFDSTGELAWMQPLDRIVIGKQVRALREVTALERVVLKGDVLAFRVVHAGKPLQCHADVTQSYARCR